jgi:hypothetical protein
MKGENTSPFWPSNLNRILTIWGKWQGKLSPKSKFFDDYRRISMIYIPKFLNKTKMSKNQKLLKKSKSQYEVSDLECKNPKTQSRTLDFGRAFS